MGGRDTNATLIATIHIQSFCDAIVERIRQPSQPFRQKYATRPAATTAMIPRENG